MEAVRIVEDDQRAERQYILRIDDAEGFDDIEWAIGRRFLSL